MKMVINPLKTNFERNKFKLKSELIILRHAESYFNIAIHDLEKKIKFHDHCEFIRTKNRIRFSPDLLDCDITEKGLNQCIEAGQNIKFNNYNIKYVFVSPMKRCLMTCENVLKSANINPQVIVHPMLFEKIEDSCDLIKDLKINMKCWNKYDWSLFYEIDAFYQLKYLDRDTLDYYKIPWNHLKNNICSDIIINWMEILEKHNHFIESSTITYNRLSDFKKLLIPFLKNNNLKNNEKILIIGHSVLFKHLTATHVSEDNHNPISNEEVLKNCEYAGLSFI